jgi:hypothetical protein
LDDNSFALIYNQSRSVKSLIGGFRRYLRSVQATRRASVLAARTTNGVRTP